MNRFRTIGVLKGYLISLLIFFLPFILILAGTASAGQLQAGAKFSEVPNYPHHQRGEFIYADIDTTRQIVYVLLEEGFWQYDLKQEQWRFLGSLENMPEKLMKLEFGYHPHQNRLLLWSRGVGRVYETAVDYVEIKRMDRSHPHRNQLGHQPFFREGALYAFGGYGYWQWNNLLTFFNKDINEWNLHDVSPPSPLPEPRAPQAGTYVASERAFYVYGGEAPVEGQVDSPSTRRVIKRDIWKFLFEKSQWEKLLTLSENDLTFYSATLSERVSRTNALSNSFFSPASGIWYLPMAPVDRVDDTFYLKPVDFRAGAEYNDIKLSFGQSKDFLPTNFLFDAKSETVIVVGVDYLSTTDSYPLRIVQIAERTLLSMISRTAPFASGSYLYYLAGFILVGVLVTGLVVWKKSKSRDGLDLPLHATDVEQLEWLNDQEKALVRTLFSALRPLESQELEEAVLTNVVNFDYRRKLRNEIIRSINKKFDSKFPDQGKLIIRQKDPNDNRRYVYSLNANLIKAENVSHKSVL